MLAIDPKQLSKLLDKCKETQIINGRYNFGVAIYPGHEYESIWVHEMAHMRSNLRAGLQVEPLDRKANREQRQRKAVIRLAMRKARKSGLMEQIPIAGRRDPSEFVSECAVIDRFDKSALPDYIKAMLKEVL